MMTFPEPDPIVCPYPGCSERTSIVNGSPTFCRYHGGTPDTERRSS